MLLAVAALLLPAWAPAQSSLPPCPPMAFKHNCFGKDMSGGQVYEGEFRNGGPDGQGIYTWPLGDKYVGEFKNSGRNGFGSFRRRDGTFFVGQWKQDNPGGEGVEYRADGTILRAGIWNHWGFVQARPLDLSKFPFPTWASSQSIEPQDQNRISLFSASAPGQGPSNASTASTASAASAASAGSSAAAGPSSAGPLSAAPSSAKPSSAAPPSEAPPNRPERRVALVVGNGAYKTAPLSNSVNDAADMAQALRGLGFEVTALQDANLRQMREATRRFEQAALTADVALIFYAGHGIEAKGRNYMVPADADIAREYELEDQAYDAGQWLAMLEGARAGNQQRVNIVILDACRDNPVSRQWRSAARGLGRMDAPSGTLLVYSTAPGRVAADGPKGQRNSPFTASLLQAMQQPEWPIEQVLKDVRRRVIAQTNGEQVPWENSSLIGDFAFRRSR
jgi:hypothetical protein